MKEFLKLTRDKIFLTIIFFFCFEPICIISYPHLFQGCILPSPDRLVIQICDIMAYGYLYLIIPFLVLVVAISYIISCSIMALFTKWRSKKPEQKNKQLSHFATGLFYFFSFIGIVAIIFFSFFYWIFANIENVSYEIRNPAKQLVAEIMPYAQAHNWQSIYDYNRAPALDSVRYWYRKLYQAHQSPNEIKDELLVLLNQKGYHMESKLSDVDGTGANLSINAGKPYWILQGQKHSSEEVDIIITDKTYYEDLSMLKYVPQGMAVIDFTFYPTPEPIPPYAPTSPSACLGSGC